MSLPFSEISKLLNTIYSEIPPFSTYNDFTKPLIYNTFDLEDSNHYELCHDELTEL